MKYEDRPVHMWRNKVVHVVRGVMIHVLNYIVQSLWV